jgi:ribosomal-protein-alanine N-acetyltransferase
MLDDVDRIMAVMTEAFDPEYGEAWNRNQVESALLMGNCHVILVGPDGEPPAEGEPAAGFALSRAIAGEEELLLFAVSPKYRRSGLGANMLARLCRDARARQITDIHLEMRRGNPAEGLYRGHGFVVVGERPNYYRTLSGRRLVAITFRYRP